MLGPFGRRPNLALPPVASKQLGTSHGYCVPCWYFCCTEDCSTDAHRGHELDEVGRVVNVGKGVTPLEANMITLSGAPLRDPVEGESAGEGADRSARAPASYNHRLESV